jgi:hypothetical protein
LKGFSNLNMSETMTNQQVAHPMVKFQRQVESLVKKSKVVRPSDPIWKIAFLFGDDWAHWKQELEEFDFSTQDPIQELLAVQSWEED